MVVGLCERFSKLPSELDEESTELLRMLEIIRLGTRKEESDGQ